MKGQIMVKFQLTLQQFFTSLVCSQLSGWRTVKIEHNRGKHISKILFIRPSLKKIFKLIVIASYRERKDK